MTKELTARHRKLAAAFRAGSHWLNIMLTVTHAHQEDSHMADGDLPVALGLVAGHDRDKRQSFGLVLDGLPHVAFWWNGETAITQDALKVHFCNLLDPLLPETAALFGFGDGNPDATELRRRWLQLLFRVFKPIAKEYENHRKHRWTIRELPWPIFEASAVAVEELGTLDRLDDGEKEAGPRGGRRRENVALAAYVLGLQDALPELQWKDMHERSKKRFKNTDQQVHQELARFRQNVLREWERWGIKTK